MSWLLVAPVVVTLSTSVLCFLAVRAPALQRLISLLGAVTLLGVSVALLIEVWTAGPLAGQMGDWPAPFGISLVADHLAAVMVVIAAITGLATVIYAMGELDHRHESMGVQPMLHSLLAGVCGAFLTGDLFNLYVWFEVMLIASFALLVLGGEKAQLDGAVKYVALNLIATVLFLGGIGLLYGMTGTLNMADLHDKVRLDENQGLLTAVAVMFLVAFGIKSAVFPLFFWLPASYHTPTVAVSAIFSGLLTKVGVYALLRTFTLIFVTDVAYTHDILLWVACLTMVTGVLGAAAQNEFRRILSFHIVSQIGYMILGLALFTPLAVIGTVFYLVHHIIVKANLFFVSGIAKRVSGGLELKTLGGLYKGFPFLALLFFIPAFSLAGFPPLSGFWAKFVLIKASLDLEAYLVAAVALGVGLLTIFSMTKIWLQAFWESRPEGAEAPPPPMTRREAWLLYGPVAALATLTLAIGIWPGPFYTLAERAAGELLDPSAYIAAVRGGLGQ